MNASLRAIILDRVTAISPLFSKSRSLCISDSAFSHSYGQIVIDIAQTSLRSSKFESILASIFTYSSLFSYSYQIFNATLSLNFQYDSIDISNCIFRNIISDHPAIEVKFALSDSNFTLFKCIFEGCTIGGNSSCVYICDSPCILSHLCYMNCSIADSPLIRIDDYSYNYGSLNLSSIYGNSITQDNFNTLLFMNSDNFSCINANLSFNSQLCYGSCLSETPTYENGGIMQNMMFTSNIFNKYMKIASIEKFIRASNLAFVNSSGILSNSYVFYISSPGGLITDVYDIKNDAGFLDFNKISGVNFSNNLTFERCFTDRGGFNEVFVSFEIIKFSGDLPSNSWGQRCEEITLSANAPTASRAAAPLSSVAWALISLSIAVPVASFVGLAIFYIRSRKRVSELTKTLDLDDALSKIS